MRRLPGIAALCLLAPLAPAGGADRKEIVLGAAGLAPPEQRADTPTPGKWWLRRDAKDWGAPGGILMTGKPGEGGPGKSGEWVVPPAHRFVPYRVPALTVDPKAAGWYRVYVGLYHDPADPYVRPRLLAKLSGEPYPEYVQAPLEARGRTAEVYWKAADLTGRKVVLEQPLAPMPHPGHGWLGGVTHLRLVPMSDAEAAAAHKEVELPPADRRLFGMLDYTDEVFWWATPRPRTMSARSSTATARPASDASTGGPSAATWTTPWPSPRPPRAGPTPTKRAGARRSSARPGGRRTST
jgi:hypothetical protein